ncbi:MAG: hypothetical protein ABW061_18755 [Polyangiaceae bacterium]
MLETRWSLIARWVVGGLLVLEALAMLFLAMGVAIIGGLAGMLAFGVGGGNATSQQLAQGFAVIVITLASPFVIALVLGVGGALLLLRLGRRLVITAGLVAIAAQLAFHVFAKEGFHTVELFPCVLHLTAIAVALSCLPPPMKLAAAT